MADARRRRLERAAALGDENATVALAAELLRSGTEDEVYQVLTMLQGLVRRNPEARDVFVVALPGGSHAFCVHCGKPIELHTDGFPRSRREGQSARGRKLCQEHYDMPYHRKRALKERYCGRCSVVKRTSGHRCTTKLPGWIVGDETGGTTRPRKHWTNWREVT